MHVLIYIIIFSGGILFWIYYQRKIKTLIFNEIEQKGGVVSNFEVVSSRDTVYSVTYILNGTKINQSVKYLGDGILKWYN